MRIKNPKAKGSRFEREVKKLIKDEIPQAEVFRSPASLGSADLICIQPAYGFPVVQLIQCKYLRKYMSKKETIKLVQDAKRICAEAFLYYRERPRGKILYQRLDDLPQHELEVN